MKTIRSIFLLLGIFCVFSSQSQSQTGPGGVGNDTTNLLWLKADILTGYSDGDPIDNWIDSSGNQNHGEQTGLSRPTYETNVINNLPAVYFDGVDDYIDTLFTVPSNNMSIFTVFAHDHSGVSSPKGPLWMCDYNASSSGFFPLFSDGEQYLHYGNSWLHEPTNFSRNIWNIATIERGNNTAILKNNLEVQSTSFNTASISKFSIGRRITSGDYFRGYITELIYFKHKINKTQQNIVSNYLSSKYNIGINNDKFSFDGNFDEALAGIGQETNNDKHLYASSDGILFMGNPTDLDNGEYLLWAHNGKTNTWTTDDAPNSGNSIQRLDREWRINKTGGDLGSVKVSIDTSNIPPLPSGYYQYVLLVDNNNDNDQQFATGSINKYALEFYNNKLRSENIILLDGDFITIGVIKPIEFQSANSRIIESENNTQIVISIPETKGSDVSVDYDVISGSASQSIDYDLPAGTATIPSGELTDTVSITIFDDNITEGSENINIKLSNPTNARLGKIKNHQLTIEDDDLFFTGPGGVGDSSSNKLWLKPESLNLLNDGDPISTWPDKSGNNHNAQQLEDSRPILNSDAINGLSAANFDGTNDFFSNIFSVNDKDMTIFSVFAHDHNGSSNPDGPLWICNESEGNIGFFPLYSNGNQYVSYGSGWVTNNSNFNRNVWYISTVERGLDKTNLWIDGSLNDSENINNLNFNEFSIAVRPTSSEHFRGEIAELIFYDYDLNDAQQNIVTNYLASKYDQTIATDLYQYEPAYRHDVAGIGREDVQNVHAYAQSADILQIGNAQDLDNGEYLLFGHNNADISSWTVDNKLGGVRLDRFWRLDETGDVGKVSFGLDTTNLPTPPEGYKDFVLTVYTTGDTTLYPMSEDKGSFEVDSVDIAGGDSVTIAMVNTVQFELESSGGSEGIGTKYIMITLNDTLATPVSVDYALSGNSTATEGAGIDFTMTTTGTINIPAGEVKDSIQIDINDDSNTETEENIIIDLSNPSGAILGPRNQHTYTISDNDFGGISGPGGVGDAATNTLWLSASNIEGLSDNDPVTSWPDTSGNLHHASPTDAAYQPSFKTDLFNGFPAVRFDGTDDHLDDTYTYDALTVMAVFNVREVFQDDYTDDGIDGDLGQLWGNYDDNAHVAIDARANEVEEGFSFDGNGSTNARYSLNGDNYGNYNDDDNTVRWQFDNTELVSVEFENQQTITQQVLGSLHPAFSEDEHNFGGDLAEMIVYDKALNAAQKIIVENYLATKYGLTLTQNDFYAYDATHKYDLAGIGREGGSNYHTAAQSANMLTIRNASSLDSADYLLFAHNNDSISTWSKTELPGDSSYYRRIKREWRLDETNDVGSYRVRLDTSQLSARPAGFTEMKLLVDADGDFTSGATSYDLNQVGSTSEFEATGMDITDGYYVTFACVRPVVGFNSIELEGKEDETAVSINLKLNLATDHNVIFDLNDDGTGTATAGGDDYNSVNTVTDTIHPGDTVTTFTLEVIDDGDPEGDETIVLYLDNIKGANLGSKDTLTYTIHDNDWSRDVQFLTGDSTIQEDIDSIGVIAELSSVNATDTTFVNMALSGTASPDSVDYDTTSLRFVIPPNDTLDTLYIPIIDDTYDEDPETIIAELTNPENAQLGAQDSIVITIDDNDTEPTIQFTNNSKAVSETDGSVNLEVALSNYSDKEITADYTVTDISATAGDDYNLADGQVTITTGNYNTFIVADILDDANIEFNEKFKVTLSSPTNATLGVNQEIAVTIQDDDIASYSFTGPGGVGNNQNNKLWLRTDSLSLADGDPVSEWHDVSGNNNDVSQSTSANMPTFETNLINGFPMVSFDGVNDYLDSSGVSYTGRDAYIVFNMSNADQGNGELAHLWGNYQEGVQVGPDPRGGNERGYSFDGEPSSGNRAKYGHNGEDYGPYATDTIKPSRWTYNTPYLVSTRFEEGQPLTHQVIGSLFPSFSVGQHQLGGDIAEIIIYNSPLNDAQKIVVENYLSSKYDIALSQNDYYTHDVGGGGSYYYDVAGIGRVDSDNEHLSSQSANMFRLYDTTGVDDGEFLLYGHNDGNYDSWVDTEVPQASFNRIEREWRLDENGNFGTVDIYLDTTLLPEFTTGYSTIEAWIDSDGDFSSGATRHEMTKDGNEFKVEGIDISDGDYITFGIIPLEINVADTTASGSEGESPIQMIVELSNTSSSTVKVDYNTSDISATAGNDYTSSSGTFVIDPGNLRDTISLTILEDGDTEANESFEVNLSNPQNVMIGEDTTFTFTILDNEGLGYTGPGGVANDTTEINVWLDTEYPADQHANGTPVGAENSVNEWKDNPRTDSDTLDAFQNNVNNQPVWYTVSPNYNDRPVIQFDGNNDELNIADNSLMNTIGIDRRFFMIAFKTGSDVSSRQVVYEEGGGTQGFNFYIEDDSLYMGGWDNEWPNNYIYNAKEIQPNTGYFAFFEFDFDGITGYIKGNVNGKSLDTASGTDDMDAHGGDISFGYGDCDFKTGSSGPTEYFGGQIAEFISGQIIPNTTQKNILVNYLSAKYGITLTSNPDLYSYDENHGYRVIGIGQESSSDNHYTAQGRDIMKISNPSDINDREYLFIGHNNGATDSWTSDNTPAKSVQRISREWRADTTGNPGTIQISVDSASIPQLPAGFDEYVLLVDKDGDFSEETTYYPLQENGNGYYVNSNVDLDKGAFFTVSAVNRVVEFKSVTSSGDESEGTITVEAVLNLPSSSNVSVDFVTHDSTASSSQTPVADYVDTTGTVVIPAGDTTGSISVTVNNETKPENNEEFKIILSNPVGGYALGEDSIHVYTIYDDDLLRKVTFLNATDTASESTSPANIEVRLTENNPDNPASVEYQILPSSTAESSDYDISETGTINFSTNDQIAFLTIPIIDDAYDEPDEDIFIRLYNPVNANMGAIDTFDYNITDNDPEPELTFLSDTISSSESVTSRDITVSLSEASGYDITFNYYAQSVTATGGGADYTLADGSVTIPAGDTTGTFTMLVTNDANEEPNEEIKLYFDLPVDENATIGSIDTTRFIIIDNDGLGVHGPGGVGNFSGQIDTWLDSYNSENLEDGDKIKSSLSDKRWIDQTGNDHDAFQGNADNQPTFWRLAPTWNGNPVIEYKSVDNHFLEIADNEAMNIPPEAQSERTIITAFRTGEDISNRQIVYEEGGGARGLNIYIENDSLYIGGWNNANDADPSTPWTHTSVRYEIQENTPYFTILEFDFEKDSAVSGFLNGNLKELPGAGLLYPHGGDIGIGAMNDDACFHDGCGGDVSYFDGFISELISGRVLYNSAQQKIVNNYLAAKYRIDLPASMDLYDYELGYQYELLGIGQDSASSNHLAAKGSGMIKIDNPSNVGDGKYMFVGHNNDSTYKWFADEVPNDDVNIRRLLREWRVDKQGGDMGAVDLHVDTSELADMPGNFSDYVIIVDDDGDFTSGSTVRKLTDNGDGFFTINGIDFDKGDYFTIGVIRPAIQFSRASSGGPENIDEYTIDLELNYNSGSDIQVDYATSDITASATQTPVADYDPMSGTVTMPAGDQSVSLNLTVNNDTIKELDESLLITLSNPSAGVAIGRDTTHTFTIEDDDVSRKVQFKYAGSSTNEDAGIDSIGVELTSANPDSNTIVQYRVLTDESTAEADSVDFDVPLTDTIVFPPNVTDTSIAITILDDLSDEYDEIIKLELFGPNKAANIGFNAIHTDTIIDNDPGPEISFTADSTSGMESISPAELDVILNVESGREVTVDYEAFDITATGASVDYQLTPGTLTFPAGVDTVKLSLDIFNDRTEEDNEDLMIVLKNPVNGSLGTKDTIRYKILDNDGLGIDGPGGVGNTQNQVDAWLRTTDMPEEIFDGVEISTAPKIWPDITGHGLDAYQPDAGARPVYWDVSTDWFGKPVLEFETGNDDYLQIDDNPRMNIASGPQNKRTIIVAFRPTSDISTHQVVYEEGGGIRGLSIYIMDDSLHIGGWNYADDQGDADESTPWGYVKVSKEIQINTPYFAVLQFNFDESGVGTVSGYLNGEDLGALPGAGRLYPHSGNIGIGGPNGSACYHHQCGGGNSFDGHISEFLSGNMVFNSAQFKLVNNYFGAKYNVALPSGNDLYDYEVNHGYEVFGIGQESSSSSHYVSQGQGPIKIENPTNAANGKYMLIGDDNGLIDKWYENDEIDVPDSSNNIVRVKREWRVDKHGGDIGDIDIYMEEEPMPNKAIGYPTYVLMVDTNDGDFTDCNIFYELADNGDGYFKAPGVDFNKGDYFTIGMVKPTVEFDDTLYSEYETDTGYVQASLNFIPGQSYQVDYHSIEGTATNNVDYDSLGGTLNFPAGTRTMEIEVILNDDGLPENSETFTLMLENPQDPLIIGDDTTTTFVIDDDDNERTIYFERSDSSNTENETSINSKVLLSKSNSTDTTTVLYSITGGTASGSGVDYTLPADTVEFLPDDTVEMITIAINDDNLDEFDEDFTIELSNPNNANIGQSDSSSYTYTILDDDNVPEVQFYQDTAAGAESYSPAGFNIEINPVSGRDITLDYTTSDITAQGGGIDYQMSDGETRQITIPAGADSATIYIDVVNDLVDESVKSFMVDISNPDYATIGNKDTSVYNIIDDDGLGYTGPGGVGDNSQYKLWYRPEAESYNDGDAVTLLTDQSGNGNNATSSGNDPIFNDNAINNRAVISFDGTKAMDIADSEDINTSSSAQTERTFVVSFRTGADVATRQVIYEEGGGTRGLNIYIENSSLYFGGWNLAEDNWGFTYVNAPVQSNTEYYAILEMNATDTLFRGWLNGSLMGTETDVNALYSHGGDIRFGANEDAVYHTGGSGSNHYYNGDIMQFLSYNYTINTAQQKIIENYFASEYRNQIETDLSADLYNYRNSHSYEVFGIGQDDINNNHTVAQGTGIVRIDQPDDIDNSEYLLAGHDNAGIASWTNTELVIDSMKRVPQEWRVTSTGNLGKVRIAVDTSLLPSKPGNYNLYGILIDSDGDFSSGNEELHPLYVRSGQYVMNHGINFSDGDYFTFVVGRNRTIASGNWHNPDIWLKGEVPVSDDDVLISVDDTVDVTADVEIGAVTMDSASVINMTGNYDFDLTEGNLSIDPDAEFNPNNGNIIYSANAPQCIGGMTYYDLEIRGSGAKTLCGNITVTHSFQIFEDAPTLSLDVTPSNYSITLNCDWQNNATFIPRNGQVTINGNNRSITTDNNGDETFYQLVNNTTGTLTLEDNVIISDTLFMNGSNINTQTDTLTIGDGGPATLSRNSGIVVGNMQIWINNTTDDYIYPIGTSSTYRPMIIKANSLNTPGYAVGNFTAADPGTDGLSTLYEDSLYMVDTYNEGFWTLSTNGLSSADYNVEVLADGYNSSDVLGTGTRLLTRPEGASTWTLDGNHADATADTIRRNNISTLSAEFAVTDTMSCMPNTSEITGPDTVCANVTDITYSVTDHAGSVYRWDISGGTQASGSNTHSITVNWGAAGSGKIKVVEDNGCAIGDTVELDVHIKPFPDDPGIISGADTIVEGNSQIYSIIPVNNATSYTWYIPGVFTGDSDSTEITLTANFGSAGSTYQIEVEGTNSCGSSNNRSSKDIYIEEGLPEKPAIPFGPVELCQDDPDTVYSTTITERASSYEWQLIGSPTSSISGTDTAGTLNLSQTFNGVLGVSVRGVNANGNGPWSDTLNVNVHPQPMATLAADPDTICEGNSTQLDLKFTAGSSPYTFIYYDDIASDTIDPIVNDTIFTPANDPMWQNGAIDTSYYYITKIVDSQGCEGIDQDTTSVIIHKKPDTGNQYYVPDDFDN